MKLTGLDKESAPKKEQGIPVTITSAAVWVVCTAVLGWAGNRLYDLAIDTKGISSAHTAEVLASTETRALLIDGWNRELAAIRAHDETQDKRIQSLEEHARNRLH